MNGVFDTRAGTIYDDDDDITSRYHFPDRYLDAAQRCLSDWIVYREPRRNNGRSGYVGVARVVSVEPDPARGGYSYTRLKNYLDLDQVVPLVGSAGPYEALLRAVPETRRWGASLQGRSVRTISPEDFSAIVRAGLDETLASRNARRLELDPGHLDLETQSLVDAPPEEQERRIEQILVNRKIRDAAFRRHVMEAYDRTCAVTGIKVINGGGKAEAQAAHIWPVADGGPDVLQNGIALCGTAHWLFDRHLISLSDDLGLVVAHNRVPVELQGLLAKHAELILLPRNPLLRPHSAYVRRHRERFAAG